MQIAATNRRSIPVEIVIRLQISLFWGLCFLFGNELLSPITDGVTYFVLGALLELFIIQAMAGLFGNTPLVRDANELTFYSFIIHLVAIPFYLNGVSSDYHNNSIYGIVVIYLVRLCYFGERRADGEFTGWAKFGALSWTCFFIGKLANTITKKRVFFTIKVVATVATIVPLWIITAQNNDKQTSLYTVLITTFILIYGYLKHFIASNTAIQTENLLNDETVALCKVYNERTSDARQIIQRIVVQDFTGPLSAAKTQPVDINAIPEAAAATISELKQHRWLLVASMIFLVVVGTSSLYTEKKAMFNFGYATGFTDGKAGAKPKQETNWDRVMRCHNRYSRFPAPDEVCYDKPPKN